MKRFILSVFAFLAFSVSAMAADTVKVGVGVDGNTVPGEHVIAELALGQSPWSLGLQLGEHQYLAKAKDLSTVNTAEALIFAKHADAVTTNVSVYQQIGLGQVQLPSASVPVTSYNVIDGQMGLVLQTGKIWTEMGLGLRDNLLASAVKVGDTAIATHYSVYPTVSIGTSF
jgi:hypothetical protein